MKSIDSMEIEKGRVYRSALKNAFNLILKRRANYTRQIKKKDATDGEMFGGNPPELELGKSEQHHGESNKQKNRQTKLYASLSKK